jgi:hypothetical protein
MVMDVEDDAEGAAATADGGTIVEDDGASVKVIINKAVLLYSNKGDDRNNKYNPALE